MAWAKFRNARPHLVRQSPAKSRDLQVRTLPKHAALRRHTINLVLLRVLKALSTSFIVLPQRRGIARLPPLVAKRTGTRVGYVSADERNVDGDGTGACSIPYSSRWIQGRYAWSVVLTRRKR